jgi:prepilin-type N-terminal cleavage/methylation domain-containing protein
MKKGFTLIEALIATLILGSVASGLIYGIIQCSNLQQNSQHLTIAMNAAQAEVEKIRNQEFASIAIGTFTFDPNGEDDNLNGSLDAGEDENGNGVLDSPFDGSGQIKTYYVAGSDNNLIDIRVAVCWRQANGRIIGEDNGAGGGTALDGRLNGTEDANGDTAIDSPCVIDAAIANKRL